MTLLRRPQQRAWDPFREFNEMVERFNTGLGKPGTGANDHLTSFDWSPSVNVSETKKAYVIKAELPEVDKDHVHVELENRTLKISGERHYEKEDEDEKHHRIESAYGSFMRTFLVPQDAVAENIEASFKNGMLKIKIPKQKEPTPSSRKIEVG